MSFRVREFLKIFPTVFEYDAGDTGFFSDPVKKRLFFIRDGHQVASISFLELHPDPETAYEVWRQKFAGTAPWRTERGRDD